MEDEPDVADDGDAPDKIKSFGDQYADVELALPAIAPDGGFAPGPVGVPPAVPSATPDHFICLRGPCKFYWELETFMAIGNPKDTFGPDGLKDPETGVPIRAPRQVNRVCLAAAPGLEYELTDELVYDCSRWTPMTARELKQQNKRRSKYLKIYPQHRPSPMVANRTKE